MNSAEAINDPSSLFRGVSIGVPKKKRQTLSMPEEKYNPYSNGEIPEGKVRIHPPQNRVNSPSEHRIHDIIRGKYVAATTENKTEAGDNMEDSTKLLLERIERDSREREARYHKDAQEREQRYRDEIQEQDRRLRQEAKEREDRIVKQIADLMASQQQSIDHKLELIGQKMDSLVSESTQTKNEMVNVTSRIDTLQGRVDSSRYFMIGTVVAILLGIAGIVYANWQVIASMIQLAQAK
ncbi:hypothetical protein [Paenibacillus peoriae]|uniref:hypothetical protein n=1 Tax=Paenibacillus peoriae TaxID=59893 RepID=UPI00096E0457|nr:hypothetical protein [Paenibacillus peoriae]OMF50897.1 hypothetical protein BK135_01140 [Paenibacillus peoriae]